YTYQWYQNNNAITGATGTTYTASASGQYTVAVSQNNCALSSAIDTVNVDAPPTTVSNNGTIICSGNTIVLSAASGAGLSYQWYGNGTLLTGQTSPTFSTDTGGSFQVQVTDAYPCTAISSVTNVRVGAPPSAVLLATGPTTFCPGGSVLIRANLDTSLNYTWNVSPTGAAGTYTALPHINSSTGHFDTTRVISSSDYVTVTEANGPCQSTSLPVQVVVVPYPTPTIVSSGSDSLCPGGSVTLNTRVGPSYTYQWVKNGANISGAITSAYVANTPGNYKVLVTNSTGCQGASPSTNTFSFANPADSIISFGRDSICAGSSVTLQAPTGVGYSYQWYQNGIALLNTNTDTLIAGATLGAGTIGNYTVKVTSNVGCAATTPTPTTIHVFAIPPTNVIPSSSTTF
ncbi:MAG: hypothetical protein P4L41_07855, partial [Flavipsychrobacter sp.]|nr:hypothetical protein [Flavipsychrobacter sp.]